MLQGGDAAAVADRMTTAGAARGAAITLDGVSIRLGNQTVVANVDLRIEPGEFVCLLGPSGCGKSTLLNLIAGFLQPSSGRAEVDGKVITGPDPERGVVFQSTEALFPWLTVRENVEYGPKLRRVSRAKRTAAALEYLDLVGLAGIAQRFPGELSGGMRQRVQIARVLVNEPTVILMDEPFGALDAQTREILQYELDRIWRARKPTIVFVTHDISESILLSDRVVTMTAGPEARIGTVRHVGMSHPRDLTALQSVELYKQIRADIAAEVRKATSRMATV